MKLKLLNLRKELEEEKLNYDLLLKTKGGIK
jgi:hypothetical protein